MDKSTIYIKRFKSSNRISHYLKTIKLVTKKYSIATKNRNKNKWELNINFPVFETKQEAEKWLSNHFEEMEV